MNLKRKLLGGLLIFAVLLTIVTVTPVEAKTDMEIAQELLYGTWVQVNSDWIKYRFDESSVKILHVSDVDPYGSSYIIGKIKENNGVWSTLDALFYIELKENEYHLNIDRRRPNGTVINDGGEKLVKVYWDSVITANEVNFLAGYLADSAIIGVLYKGDIVEVLPSLTGSRYGFENVKVIRTANKNIKVGTEGYVSVKYLR